MTEGDAGLRGRVVDLEHRFRDVDDHVTRLNRAVLGDHATGTQPLRAEIANLSASIRALDKTISGLGDEARHLIEKQAELDARLGRFFWAIVAFGSLAVAALFATLVIIFVLLSGA